MSICCKKICNFICFLFYWKKHFNAILVQKPKLYDIYTKIFSQKSNLFIIIIVFT